MPDTSDSSLPNNNPPPPQKKKKWEGERVGAIRLLVLQ